MVETDKLGRERGENWGRSLNRVIDMDGQKRAGWPLPPHFNSPRSSLSASSPARRPLRPTTPRLQPSPLSPPFTPDDNHVGRPEARSSLLVPCSALSSESQPASLSAGSYPPNTNPWLALSLQTCSAIPAASATGPTVREGTQVISEGQAEPLSSAGASSGSARRGRQEAESVQAPACQPYRQEQQAVECTNTGEASSGSSICQANLQSEG